DATSNALATLQQANTTLRQQIKELPKLRGEVARLRSESQELGQPKATNASDPTESEAKSWLDRVGKLKQALARLPDQEIPELRYLTEQDWLNAVKNSRQMTTDDDLSQALSTLRISAKHEVALRLRQALRAYSLANNGQSPTDVSLLKPYFTPSMDE